MEYPLEPANNVTYNKTPVKRELAPLWLIPFGMWTVEMLQLVDDNTLHSFVAFASKIGDGTIWEKEVRRRLNEEK
jgi:hypothetical protein